MERRPMVRDYTNAQIALIRRTVAKDCNPDEFDLFVEVCRRVGLDPFRRQIHALVFSKDKPDKRQMAIVTGIDGYRAIAARNADYRPDENPPEIKILEDLKDPKTNPLGIEHAVVRAHKKDADGWHPVAGIAYWEEFAPLREIWKYDEAAGRRQPTGEFELDAGNWRRMPKIMIAKCAEAQALRKGWPEDLSGLYAEEELHQAVAHDLSASEAAEHAETEQRLARISAARAVPILWQEGEQLEFVPLGQVADRIMAHIKAHPDRVAAWKEQNAQGLRQFWAQCPSDALEIKKEIERHTKSPPQNQGRATKGPASAAPRDGRTPDAAVKDADSGGDAAEEATVFAAINAINKLPPYRETLLKWAGREKAWVEKCSPANRKKIRDALHLALENALEGEPPREDPPWEEEEAGRQDDHVRTVLDAG